MRELVGARLGAYHLLERVGTGGMAAVYRAYHPATQREVAVTPDGGTIITGGQTGQVHILRLEGI